MTDLAEKLLSERTGPASVSRFDRAWGVVVGAGLLMFVNLGPVLYYTSGIFTKAITDDTGWTRGTIAAASLPANLLITFTLPWSVGLSMLTAPDASLLSRYCSQWACCWASSPTPGCSRSCRGRVPVASLTPLPYAQIVSGWFDKRRGGVGTHVDHGGLGTALLRRGFCPYRAGRLAQCIRVHGTDRAGYRCVRCFHSPA